MVQRYGNQDAASIGAVGHLGDVGRIVDEIGMREHDRLCSGSGATGEDQRCERVIADLDAVQRRITCVVRKLSDVDHADIEVCQSDGFASDVHIEPAGQHQPRCRGCQHVAQLGGARSEVRR